MTTPTPHGGVPSPGLNAAVGTVERLRAALIRCGRAAGCGLADNVSTDFLMGVPHEVEAAIAVGFRREPAGAAEGWRGISSAPRDAPLLLLIDGRAVEGVYSGPSDGSIYSGRPSASQYNWFDGQRTVHDSAVTHWMPLPAAPTLGASDAE